MKQVSVSVAGSVGLITQEDRVITDLPPNAWNVASNVRFKSGSVEAAKGWIQEGSISSVNSALLDYVTGGLSTWWIHYGNASIYTVRGNYTSGDVTRSSGSYTSGEWVATNFQGIPVATNGVDLPQTQFVAGGIPVETTLFQDLPGWPTSDRCRLIATLKNFLVAFDVTETGTRYKTKIKWSNAAAPANIPADWNVASPTSLAGEIVISTAQGAFVAVAPMRDFLVVYRSNGVGILEYIGGNQIMRYREVSNRWGAFGPHCAVSLRSGMHLVATRDDIVIFDGQSERSVATGRVRKALFRVLGQYIDTSHLVRMSSFPEVAEVWLGIPSDDTSIKYVYVYNYDEDTWAGPRTVPNLRDFKYLPQLSNAETTNLQLSWEEAANTPGLTLWSDWDAIPWNVTSITTTSGEFHFFGTSVTGSLIKLDFGFDHQGVTNYLVDLARYDFNLGGDEFMQVILAIYPRGSVSGITDTVLPGTWEEMMLIPTATWDDSFWGAKTWDQFPSGENPLVVSVGSQAAVGSSPVWSEEKVFVPGQYKVTFKQRGRRHAIRFKSEAIKWRLTGYDVEFVDSGR